MTTHNRYSSGGVTWFELGAILWLPVNFIIFAGVDVFMGEQIIGGLAFLSIMACTNIAYFAMFGILSRRESQKRGRVATIVPQNDIGGDVRTAENVPQTDEFENLRKRCIAWCGAGLLVAYALVIPLKYLDGFPANFSWLQAIALPVVIFSYLAGILWIPSFSSRHYYGCVLVATFIFVILLAAIYLS